MATIPNQIRIDTDIKKQADNIFNNKTLEAMAEARRISRDPDTPSYSSMNDLRKALLSDWCIN